MCRRLANPAPASSIATRIPRRRRSFERRGQHLVVLDRLVLGDLDHHPRRVAVDERGELRRHRGARRAVDGQVGAVRQVRDGRHRAPDRHHLQLDAELQLHGRGEPFVRRPQRQGVEPGERLHADDRTRSQVDDRLIHHGHAAPGEEPVDLPTLRRAMLVSDLLAAQLRRELVHDAVDQLGGQARSSVDHLGDRTQEVLARRALHEVADGAGAEHLEHRGAVLERGQRDHAGVGRDADDLARRARAAAGRHAHVDDRDVRSAGVGELDRLVRVAGLADQDQALLVRQQVGERTAQGRLVVGDQDTDRRRGSDRSAGGSSDGNHGEDRTGSGGGVQSPGEATAETPECVRPHPPPGVLSMRRSATCGGGGR